MRRPASAGTERTAESRYFKGDRWTRAFGCPVPDGAEVRVVRFYPRRKALIEYEGKFIVTMLWCLSKRPPGPR